MENNEIWWHAQLFGYSDTLVTIRIKDGAQINHTTSPYPKILLDFCETGKWEKAIKICRFVKEKTLWEVLASILLYFLKDQNGIARFFWLHDGWGWNGY